MLSSASDTEKLFPENFSKNCNLDESGIYLCVFPSRTILKLHISVTPKMVKKVKTNLYLAKGSGPDSSGGYKELSYILVGLFNKRLKESCFPECWKISLVVPVFKNVGERFTAKNYHPVIGLLII